LLRFSGSPFPCPAVENSENLRFVKLSAWTLDAV
jgi:hypothetical protein